MNQDLFQAEINKAIEVLKAGGTVLYPTDTVWGIGCDATNEAAVSKIFQIKQRAESKSLILLLDEDVKLNRYIRDVPGVAWEMIECTENPLTIVYAGAYNIAKNAINNEDGTVAIRITKEAFSKALVRKLNRPLVSTSANISGANTPALFNEISPEIINSVDYIVNWRQNDTTRQKSSTIMKIDVDGTFKFIRK